MSKNYDLLRPFDLGAARSGDLICWYIDGEVPEQVAISKHGSIAVLWCGETTFFTWDAYNTQRNFRMDPLAWVEGKPVYIGDVLYTNVQDIDPHPNGIRVTGIYPNGLLIWESIGDNRKSVDGYSMHLLTWSKPKVKHEGWMNIYGYGCTVIHPTKAEADSNSTSDRIDCIHIKWEE